MKLFIKYLGEIKISINNNDITNNLSEKAKGILAYIVMNNKITNRNKLIELFWSDFEKQSANNNLRHAIWNIRNAVKSIDNSFNIIKNISKTTIKLNESCSIESDVMNFYHISNNIFIKKSINKNEIRNIMQTYKEEFLDNFYIYDSIDFNNWIFVERERIKKDYFSLLRKLADYLKTKKDYNFSIEIIKELIEQDPYNEQLYLELMKLYIVLGNRNYAIKTYGKVKNILREDLYISPNNQIRKLYESIISNKNNHPIILKSKDIHLNIDLSKLLPKDKNVTIIINNSNENFKNIKKLLINHEKKNHFIELTKVPGRRIAYEGIFEFLNEYNHICNDGKNNVEIDKILSTKVLKINEYKLFYNSVKYLLKNANNKYYVVIYNLSHIDEKSIDFFSYMYRNGVFKKIKFIASYEKSWETNRIKLFVDALSEQDDVEILHL